MSQSALLVTGSKDVEEVIEVQLTLLFEVGVEVPSVLTTLLIPEAYLFEHLIELDSVNLIISGMLLKQPSVEEIGLAEYVRLLLTSVIVLALDCFFDHIFVGVVRKKYNSHVVTDTEVNLRAIVSVVQHLSH